jgi:hypothetical protein
MHNAAPSLQEIIQLTREELTSASKEDPIRECGRAALSLLPSQPDVCLKLAYQKLHDVPYKEVKACWRRLHADASLWEALRIAEGKTREEADAVESWVGEIVRILDTTLIFTSAPQREEVIELWFMALKDMLPSPFMPLDADTTATERPTKRQKRSTTPLSFATSLPSPGPTLRHPIPRATNPSLATFQAKLANPATHTPLVIKDSISHWPALHERPWSDPAYLLSQTLNGLRLVPVEIGSSYVSPTWTQRILSMRDFMQTYMLAAPSANPSAVSPAAPGYLAQHDLLTQIPSLRADLAVPDYCYLDPCASSPTPSPTAPPRLATPLLNAWFGPAGTVSPLHTDPYHNILAQVVGHKYIRLYAPAQTRALHPRGTDENGVDMQNTSAVDLDWAVSVVPGIGYAGGLSADGDGEGDEAGAKGEENEAREEFERLFPGFAQAEYVECVLGPGECLYLPPGWWHYVRSLTASFSVSFWWN